MEYISYSGGNQKTLNSHIGGNKLDDYDAKYIENQKNILSREKQNALGKIPPGIRRTSHSDPIQSARFGYNSQEIDLGTTNTTPDKYHEYNPYYDYLNKNGLLRENFKYRLNTTTINVDSSSRNIDPIIKYDEELKLTSDPLSFDLLSTVSGINASVSNLLKIYCPNHGFVKGDRFTLGGINNPTIQINTNYIDINNIRRNSVIFTPGSTSVAFVCSYDIETADNTNNITFDPNFKVGHGIKYDTLKTYDTADLNVRINGFSVSNVGTPYIGNIPINFLNSVHRVYFTNPDLAHDDTLINIPFDVTSNEKIIKMVKITGFYISLDTVFDGNPPTANMILYFNFNYFGGIALHKLNAEFPIDSDHSIGYHEVYSTSSDQIDVTISNTPYYYNKEANNINSQSSFGGNDVYISKIIDLKYGNNNPNSYIINLPRSLHNVTSVKLLSTTFPNTSKIIRNTLGNNNNMLYWQNQDDGNFTYSIEIPTGNYTPQSLITTIEKQIYAVPRKYAVLANTSTNYTNANFMNVTIDTDTNIVTFKSYKEAKLISPIQSITPPIPDKGGNPPFTLTIKQSAHGLKIGDIVLFSGFITTMGIPDTILNTNQTVVSVPTPDTYTIILNNFNLFTGTRTDTQGGNAAKAYVPNHFKLLFNTKDTIGSLLGFRNVGLDTSITKFNTVISNTDAYLNEILTSDTLGNLYVYDRSGNTTQLTSNNIKLCGYDYIIMSIQELNKTINLSTSLIPFYFAKINLSGLPGKILYDTFVQTSTVEYDPLNITTLTLNFYAPDGSLFDFNGLDHSFVLEFTTMDHVIVEEGVVSNKTIM